MSNRKVRSHFISIVIQIKRCDTCMVFQRFYEILYLNILIVIYTCSRQYHDYLIPSVVCPCLKCSRDHSCMMHYDLSLYGSPFPYSSCKQKNIAALCKFPSNFMCFLLSCNFGNTILYI